MLHCDLRYDANIFDACTFTLLRAFKSVWWSKTISKERTLMKLSLKEKLFEY